MPTGGSAFAWYQELFNKSNLSFLKECENLYQDYMNNHVKLNDSLLFLPHLNGSGAPFKTVNRKGFCTV